MDSAILLMKLWCISAILLDLEIGLCIHGNVRPRAALPINWSSVHHNAMSEDISVHGKMAATFARILSPPSRGGAAITCTIGSTCTPLRLCSNLDATYSEPACSPDTGNGPSICCADKYRPRSLEAQGECGIEVKMRAFTANQRTSGRDNMAEKPTPHVFGGHDVQTTNAYPFMAGIYLKIGMDAVFLCGATLISRTTLLCAAHCFLDMLPPNNYIVHVGTITRHQSDQWATRPTTLTVLSVLVHPDFRHPHLYHDIALIGIESIRSFSDSVRPICLPLTATKQSEGRGARLTVLGWGAHEFGGGTSAILQEAIVPVVNRQRCQNAYARIHALRNSYPDGITDRLLCAGNVNQSRDACQGDSGGPLIRLDRRRLWRQEGIVSAGAGCGTPGIPGVYTRVVHYLDWIDANAT